LGWGRSLVAAHSPHMCAWLRVDVVQWYGQEGKVTPGSLLSTASSTVQAAGAGAVLVGAIRVNSTDVFHGWTWADGSPADTLNCGSPGCGIWAQSSPRWVLISGAVAPGAGGEMGWRW
jgi:hypothetical protein